MFRFTAWIVMILGAALVFGTATAAADEIPADDATRGSSQESLIILSVAVPTGPTTWAEKSVDEFADVMGLPRVAWVTLSGDQLAYSNCDGGTIYTSRQSYVYCPVDGESGQAYIGEDHAKYFESGTTDLAGAILTAHEWGHHLHNVQKAKSSENGADCVAGAWLKWYSDTEHIPVTIDDAIGILNLTQKIGRPVDVPASSNRPHGRWFERGAAGMVGFTGGLMACNMYARTI